MQGNRTLLKTGGILNILFIASYLFIVVAFFLSQFVESSQKSLWGDETYSLQYCIRNHGYFDILLNGAQPQGSPAPLDYLACKFLDQIKEKVSYLGMTPEVYFRLFANLVTIFSILVIMFLFKKEIFLSKEIIQVKAAQLFLLLCLPIVFLFTWQVYYYAAEMRPYALWTSLFLTVLAVSLLDLKSNRLFFATLILLSLSATAAIFQLNAIASAYFIVRFIQKDNFKDISKKAVRLFAIPYFIVIYYCLRVGKMGFEGGDWGDFFELWNHKAILIPTMMVIIALCLIKEENRRYSLASLSLLILFIMGPVIFWVTRLKGFFFADRQFIYYELARPVFILTAIKCIPAYVRNIKSRFAIAAVLLVFCFLGAALTFNAKRLIRFDKARVNAARILNIPFKF